MNKENKTMRIIGAQSAQVFIDAGDGLVDVIKAHIERGTHIDDSLVYDAYILGYMAGKRAERAKRKKHTTT